MNIWTLIIIAVIIVSILLIYRMSQRSNKMMAAAMEYAQHYGRIPQVELDKILVDPEFMTWSQEKIKVISPDQIKSQGVARIFGQLFIDYSQERKSDDQQQ